MKKFQKALALAIVLLTLFSMVAIIGTDTGFGKVEVSRLTLATADGDELSCLLYKPESATPENPAPAVMLAHGGNDMAEQMTSYAIELSRRGYVVITRDATNHHNSDVSTGPDETSRVEAAGYRPMGLRTVLATLQRFTFVDNDHICALGHSLGATNTLSLAIDTQANHEVFLTINLGQNMYGSKDNRDYNFNFDVILGDADEACLMLTNPPGNTYYTFQTAQLKRIFTADYETPDEELKDIEFAKVYTVTGTDGGEYTRTAYRPSGTHAYYMLTNDSIQTCVYAITSRVGFGLDEGVNSYADHGKISTIWYWHDIGYLALFIAMVLMMGLTASLLIEKKAFEGLHLSEVDTSQLAYKKNSWQWWVILVVLVVSTLLLFKYGILVQSSKAISKLWLVGGNNNVIIGWQWCSALLMLVIFLLYHFTYGKKMGGNRRTYGLATSETGKVSIAYLGKAFAFAFVTVCSAYLLLAFVSSFTKQGLHIGTFQISTINPKRWFIFIIYFLFQIPYFVISSLAFKSLGLSEGAKTGKGTALIVLRIVLVSVGLLFAYWMFFVIFLYAANTLPGYFINPDSFLHFLLVPGSKIVVYNMLILPLTVTMAAATGLNVYVTRKTNSLWTGCFTALLFGTWMLVSCGEVTKFFY